MQLDVLSKKTNNEGLSNNRKTEKYNLRKFGGTLDKSTILNSLQGLQTIKFHENIQNRFKLKLKKKQRSNSFFRNSRKLPKVANFILPR